MRRAGSAAGQREEATVLFPQPVSKSSTARAASSVATGRRYEMRENRSREASAPDDESGAFVDWMERVSRHQARC